MTGTNGYWLNAARAVKKAFLGRTREKLGGSDFVLAYEARTLKQEEDYPYLLELARGKKCVFDVGANIGRTSLLMSTVLPDDGEIVVFEASEYACRILIENIELNGLGNRVFPVNTLVADSSGRLADFYWEYASGGASPIAGFLGHRFPVQKATLSLDDYVLQTGKSPDFVKIDVEGGEEQVLLGMTHILASIRPIIAIEIHSWDSHPLAENAGRVFQVLNGAGYSIRDLISDEPVKMETISQWDGYRRFVVGIFADGRIS